MIPTPVLVTFVLVAGIIGSAYYLLVLKPEEDEQRALRKRLKTSGVTSKGRRRSWSPAYRDTLQSDSDRQCDPGV